MLPNAKCLPQKSNSFVALSEEKRISQASKREVVGRIRGLDLIADGSAGVPAFAKFPHIRYNRALSPSGISDSRRGRDREPAGGGSKREEKNDTRRNR